MLSNASLVGGTLLHPPAYGFEAAFHRPPPPAEATPGTHQQLVVQIDGAVDGELASHYVRTEVFVRGALWRAQTHPLCTALDADPENERRACARGGGGGAFSARVWAFVPSTRPGGRLRPKQMPEMPAGTLAHARERLRAAKTHDERLAVAADVLRRTKPTPTQAGPPTPPQGSLAEAHACVMPAGRQERCLLGRVLSSNHRCHLTLQ
jgi:hypothetical protein